jgi:hypothetical protein
MRLICFLQSFINAVSCCIFRPVWLYSGHSWKCVNESELYAGYYLHILKKCRMMTSHCSICVARNNINKVMALLTEK